MTISQSMLLLLALVISPAQAAFPNLTKIYRFTGIVVGTNTDGNGVQLNQTVIQCTNWSANQAQVQVIIYNGEGTTIAGPVYPLNQRQTFTATTNALTRGPFSGIDHNIALSPLGDGSMEIRATNPQVHCNVKRVWVFWNFMVNEGGLSRDVASVSIDTLNGVRYRQEGSNEVQE
jgi:hypothetical protein